MSEISSNIKEIAFHEHGRKVIMYLLAGRDTRYTHPQVIDILKQGDNNVHRLVNSMITNGFYYVFIYKFNSILSIIRFLFYFILIFKIKTKTNLISIYS